MQIGHALGDKFLGQAPAAPLPGWIRSRQAHFILEVGKRPAKPRQLVFENDVRTRAHTIEKRHSSSEFEIVDITQHRSHGCNPTSGRNENYAFVECLVKVKPSVRSACFHREAWLGPLIKKNRYTSIFHALGRDFHIVLVDPRRRNGVRPPYSLAINRPLERQELPWLSTKPSFV